MDLLCRNELGYHPVNVYLNITCALCYIYTFHSADHRVYPLTYANDGFLAGGHNGSDLYLPTAFDRSSPVFSAAFPADEETEHDGQLWRDCCQAAADCCAEQLKHFGDGGVDNGDKTCPSTWDGWQCWNRTKSGVTVAGSCPSYINPVSSPVCSAGKFSSSSSEMI